MPFDRHAKISHRVALPGASVTTGQFRPSGDHPTDRWFHPEPTKLPAHVDLRDDFAHVKNQLDLDSCTANALASVLELLEHRAARFEHFLSRLFIYYNARVIEHDVAKDDGITIRDGVHALRRHGACKEMTWPYVASRVLDRPTESAFEEAKRHRIDGAERVHIDADAVRACIAKRDPVVFGVQLFASFESGGNHGRIPMPRPGEEKHIGGHTMVATGYDDADRVFIVRNSWGKDWGERGYCFLPYEYVADRKFTDEMWVLRSA